MRFGSLFSGIGGFDLGFERAGMECAWQVEIEPACRTLLAAKFPGAQLEEDVSHVGRANLAAVDLICGGFPCQDVSVAGQRAGLAGERSGLWHQFHRVLEELRPRWVVVENVPGLLSSNGGRDFAVIIRGLVELGYRVSWRILDAQHFGLAQRRRRVFIVGSLGDGSSAQVLFESESVPRNHPARSPAREGTAPTLASRTRGGGGLGTDAECDGALIPAIPILEAGARTGRSTDDTRCGLGVGEPGDPMFTLQSGKQHAVSVDIVPAITSKAAKGTGGPSGDECQNLVAFTVPSVHRGVGNAWNSNMVPQPATFDERNITSPGNRSTLIAQGVRRLTPVECSRLQGFPDDWLEGLGFSDSTKYKQLGNAVPVPVATWIGQRIKGA